MESPGSANAGPVEGVKISRMSRAIGVVTVARSDYGHLTPLLQALHGAPDVELLVYIAGSHLAARFGRTASLVEADGWDIAARVDMDIDDDAPGAIAAATGRGVTGFAREFARRTPDILVVLGDRYEMLSAAVAALPFALPVAHLHGGEVTEGAIDEQIRHAITKLAHLHFPAAEPYAAAGAAARRGGVARALLRRAGTRPTPGARPRCPARRWRSGWSWRLAIPRCWRRFTPRRSPPPTSLVRSASWPPPSRACPAISSSPRPALTPRIGR